MPCYRTHDANGEFVGILCGRLGPACVQCGDVASVLCDFPIGDEGKTCDKHLCARCSPTVGADKNYCKEHQDGHGMLLFRPRKLTDAEIMEKAKAVLREIPSRRLPRAPAPEHRWRAVARGDAWGARTGWITELAARQYVRTYGGADIQTWDEFVALWRQKHPLKPRGKPRPLSSDHPSVQLLNIARKMIDERDRVVDPDQEAMNRLYRAPDGSDDDRLDPQGRPV